MEPILEVHILLFIFATGLLLRSTVEYSCIPYILSRLVQRGAATKGNLCRRITVNLSIIKFSK